jgi:hypothetical protein
MSGPLSANEVCLRCECSGKLTSHCLQALSVLSEYIKHSSSAGSDYLLTQPKNLLAFTETLFAKANNPRYMQSSTNIFDTYL